MAARPLRGVDHRDFIDAALDVLERRVVRGLQHLRTMHPGGDCEYFVDGDASRWRDIVILGISHGPYTPRVVGVDRLVPRAVLLSEPLDRDQAGYSGRHSPSPQWSTAPPLPMGTPIDS